MSIVNQMTPHQTIRIAHFSDTHVLALNGTHWTDFLNKRISGAVNLALNRAKHYRVEMFERLLDHIISLQPDHSICTGDLVNLALQPEFLRVKAILNQRFSPQALTLVPGNHDYYTKEVESSGIFEKSFPEYLPQELLSFSAHYPISRRLKMKDQIIDIIGLSTAKSTAMFMARGEIGDAQIQRLEAVCQESQKENAFQILMLHHPLFPSPERKLESMRKLDDAEALLNFFYQKPMLQPDLIVHGHNHCFRKLPLYHLHATALPNYPPKNPPVVQVGSASRFKNQREDLPTNGNAAEFHIYVIENQRLKAIERHIYSQKEDRFIACDEAGIANESSSPIVTHSMPSQSY